MARFFKKRHESIGLAPGSLTFIGVQKTDEVQLRLIDYDAETLREEELREVRAAAVGLERDTVTWINVNGLHDVDTIRELGSTFDLHPLLLEDLVNTGQRPKLEEFENVLFVVVKMLRYDETNAVVIAEQLSLVLGETFLLTFQERPGDVFEPVRNRIRHLQGRVRISGSDYLAYALLDTVVDNYIHIIEMLGSKVEDLEVEVLSDPRAEVLATINSLKREVSYMRKGVRPAREAILKLSKLDSDLIRPQTGPFLKDLFDIATQATEAIDTYREMLSDALNIYNSTVSNRMNDIMKVLTIFAAIFIPLTFVAGVYGTNFEYLPELKWRYSYFALWGFMITVAGAMLLYFRRKNWL